MHSPESDCSEESSCYLTGNSGDSEPEFAPFDETIKPLASFEEIAECEESIRLYSHGVVFVNFYIVWKSLGSVEQYKTHAKTLPCM